MSPAYAVNLAANSGYTIYRVQSIARHIIKAVDALNPCITSPSIIC